MEPTIEDIEKLYHTALKKEPGAERAAFLAAACGHNHGLQAKVEALLKTSEEVGDFLAASPLAGEMTLEEPTLAEGPGTTIGRYKLLEIIGEGGFGVVWAAVQKDPVKRRVALKIIKLGMDTKQVIARFEAERQALALMDHPNIAKVLDGGSTDNGRPYFVMELVRGIPIIAYCDQEKLSIQKRLDLFIKVCHAIQHAHQKGIIHRDIKPSNILITLHDGVPVPRVIDFGIAKATQQELTENTLYTLHRQFIGTPVYMSPEQAEMSGLDIDTRSDIYSLGVLLYELLTGKTPFDEKELLQSGIDAMRKMIREQEPQKPSTKFATLLMDEQSTTATRHATDSPRLISRLRGDLDWIVMKCLEKDRVRRYDTANGLALDVNRHLKDEPVIARPPTLIYQFQKAWHRNKLIVTAACLVLASLILGISLSLWQAWIATGARRDAEAATAREFALREEAQAGERKQRLIAYAADMKLGREYLSKHNFLKVEEILARYVPKNGEKDIRDVEWQHLRQTQAGNETHTFPHETEVRSLSLAADGTRLASITMSGKVRLFDVESGKVLQSHGGGNLSYGTRDGSVALSPDGRFLAADQQGTLRVWDATSEVMILDVPGVAAPIDFSPDSRTLVAVTETGLHRWNTTDWTSDPLLNLASAVSTARVQSLVFTPDSNRIIFTPSRFASRLIVCNLANGTVETELEGLDRPHVISTDGILVSAGGREGQVCIWNLANRELVRRFKAHNSIVVGVALSPDGTVLATGGNDSEIRLWDTRTYRAVGSLRGHHSQVWDLEYSRDGQQLASAGMDKSVKLWNWRRSHPGLEGGFAAGQLTTARTHRDIGIPTTVDDDSGSVRKQAHRTHRVTPDDSIQAVINGAAPGDRIELAPGLYQVKETIVVDKPLVVGALSTKEEGGQMPVILKGASGLVFVLQVETRAGEATEIRNLQIESQASGIQHHSGDLTVRNCRVIIRSALEFQKVISLEAMGVENGPADTVALDGCTLQAEYIGDTAAHTPPDADIVLAAPSSRYREITVVDCDLMNKLPNAISNGIETRSTTAHLTIRGNRIHCQGMGVVIPNHNGSMDIVGNTIGSTRVGIIVGTESPDRSNITGNHITVEKQPLRVYPVFVQQYIAPNASSCIRIGSTSAGVAAAFFKNKDVIGRGTHIWVERNVLKGNPKYGIALIDSPEPESYGPPTPNDSHDNIITHNDLTDLKAEWGMGFGASTFNNLVVDNEGLDHVFREAGDNDRNHITLD